MEVKHRARSEEQNQNYFKFQIYFKFIYFKFIYFKFISNLFHEKQERSGNQLVNRKHLEDAATAG